MLEYTVVHDNDTHSFVIPTVKLKVWWEWLESEDYELGHYPDWAKHFSGRITFNEYKIN